MSAVGEPIPTKSKLQLEVPSRFSCKENLRNTTKQPLLPGSEARLLSWRRWEKGSEVNAILSSFTTTSRVLNNSSKASTRTAHLPLLQLPSKVTSGAAVWWHGQK